MEIPFDWLSEDVQKELRRSGCDNKLILLETRSGGYFKFTTTAATICQVMDLSLSYFTTQDAKGWTSSEAKERLRPRSDNTCEFISEATMLPGTLYAEGSMPGTIIKQLCIISGPGIYMLTARSGSTRSL